jgi:hypothetical protein
MRIDHPNRSKLWRPSLWTPGMRPCRPSRTWFEYAERLHYLTDGTRLLCADGKGLLRADGKAAITDGTAENDACECGGVAMPECSYCGTATMPTSIAVSLSGFAPCPCFSFGYYYYSWVSGNLNGTYDLTQTDDPCVYRLITSGPTWKRSVQGDCSDEAETGSILTLWVTFARRVYAPYNRTVTMTGQIRSQASSFFYPLSYLINEIVDCDNLDEVFVSNVSCGSSFSYYGGTATVTGNY